MQNLNSCNCEVFVPTAFTPNSDGMNDDFGLTCACDLDKVQFNIFNRWGELVFESSEAQPQWNGQVNGRVAQQGTYVWQLHAIVNEWPERRREIRTGSVTLLK